MSCFPGSLDLSTLTLTVNGCNILIKETVGSNVYVNMPISDSTTTYIDGVLNVKNGVQAITLTDAQMTLMSATPATIVAAIDTCKGIT